ncbi:MAG: adaptor protein MecA, partial [Peptococcaceae bacterium]|nr:adaptor protein MecA [Peptococcaceae bacterium]
HLLFDVHYDGDSQLLRYKDKYYLAIMEYEWLTEYGLGLLGEYGTPVTTSIAFFREHGELVMEHKALDILSKL